MRKLYLLAFILVVLSLGCAEIPELLTICDNTSNDFLLNVASSKLSSPQTALVGVASKILPDSNSGRCFCQLGHASPQVLPLTGRDLLTLHSLQKK